jgi:putative two-component system response regulator
MDRQHVLVIDDDIHIAAILERLLKMDGHLVTVIQDGEQALALVESIHPDLVLTDLDMPCLNGFEVCRRIKQSPKSRLLPVVIITGNDAQQARLQAWEMGADDFLTKPFDSIEVRARCRSLLRVSRLLGELDSAESVVFSFARAVEAKSPHTWGHSERVGAYALELARALRLSQVEQDILRKGAALHDIGKINIPDAILNKPGPLTSAEFEIVQQHPTQGVHIVEPLQSMQKVLPLIRWHHERLDGGGYPDGLMGGSLPLLVRILAVADVFDALSSPRPYRPALPREQCLEILTENAASGGLDPELAHCFGSIHLKAENCPASCW